MTQEATVDAYGVLAEPATLKIQRILPGPVERVWAYLTESDLRRQWLASAAMEMKVGASFELVWRNSELTDAPSNPPADFGEEHRMESRITELDPPRKLAFTWGTSGNVSIALEPQGEQVLLTLIHRGLPSRDVMLKVAAGWHAHLDVLVAKSNGENPQPFWDRWSNLHREYGQRIPA